MGYLLRLIALVISVFLACACDRGPLVALAPDPDGKVGSISVSNEAGSVAIDTPYQATTIRDARVRPGAPRQLGKKALDEMFAEALLQEPKKPLHFLLYFDSDTTLTPDSLQGIPDIVAAIRERNSMSVTVVGHTDTVGTREMNPEMSIKRALAVMDLLVGRGVDPATIRIAYHGKENPLIPTADNVREPKNRRVEVVVR